MYIPNPQMALLECCLSNISPGAQVALDESEHKVRESICLDRCGDCYAQPFLVIDGNIHLGESHQDILDSVDCNQQVFDE